MKPDGYGDAVKRLFNTLLGNKTPAAPAAPSAAPPADPDRRAHAEDAKNRGNAFLAEGQLDRARECYQEALRLAPAFAEAAVNLGYVCMQQQRATEAEMFLKQAIQLKPELWQAHLNLGILHEARQRFDEALACYRRAGELQPDRAECHWRPGAILQQRAQLRQAAECYEKALAIDPGLVEIRTNLANILTTEDRLDEALAQFDIALKTEEHAGTHYLAAIAQLKRYRRDAALAHLRRAIEIDPANHGAHFVLALQLLLSGDYENGLAHFEQRLCWRDAQPWVVRIQEIMAALGRQRYWQGDALDGKSILVWGEQGLGDVLMMLRYLPLLKRDKGAARVQLVCPPPLAALARGIPEIDAVIERTISAADIQFDCHCAIMSLPYLFGTRLDRIPAAPYLHAPADKKAFWAERLAGLRGRRIGLAWGGNKDLSADALRSIALEKFAPLLALPGIDWISLQKGERQDELKALGWPIRDWMDECHDLQDTAALMENLDLIVAVDTSVVHLAGALGRPTWLLNRYGSEWRWLLDRSDTPWYPSMRIFNQPAPKDWDAAIAAVAAALGQATG